MTAKHGCFSLIVLLAGSGWLLHAADTVITVAGGGSSTDEGVPATSTLLYMPFGVAVDGAGNLYVADSGHGKIRKVEAATGLITTLAGGGAAGTVVDGDSATAVSLYDPRGVAVNAAGDVFIADYSRILKVTAATGTIETLAGNGQAGFSGDGGPAKAAQVFAPRQLALDVAGNLYIADSGNARVRRIDATTGVIRTVAGSGVRRYAGDGGPATAAGMNVAGVAVDAAENVYIADDGANRIRKVDAGTGLVSTFAGRGVYSYDGDGGPAVSAALQAPNAVAVDTSGNVFIADTLNYCIRRVETATGVIQTTVGSSLDGFFGDGRSVQLAAFGPVCGVAVDTAGRVYLADTLNHRIREAGPVLTPTALYDTDGDGFPDYVETVAGTSPTDASSTPFGGLPVDQLRWLIMKNIAVKLNFSTSGKDSLTLQGTLLEMASGVPLNGQQVLLDAGGVCVRFSLDAKGNSTPKGANSFKLSVKGTTGKFTAKLVGDFAAQFKGTGMVNADAKKGSAALATSIYFDQAVYVSCNYLQYNAKVNRNGLAHIGTFTAANVIAGRR
jgi:sugar lactone lactonase YvrE